METKLLTVVKGIKHCFLLRMILICVKVKLWPDQAQTIKRETVEHLGGIAYSILAYNTNGPQSSQVAVAEKDPTPLVRSPLLEIDLMRVDC